MIHMNTLHLLVQIVYLKNTMFNPGGNTIFLNLSQALKNVFFRNYFHG